jgi:quercetin dioxygenase-like cupin family protein
MSGGEPAAREGGSRDGESYFLPAGSGSRHVIFPGVEILTTAGANMMLSVVRFEPRSVVAEHAHPHEQMGILLEGRLEFTVGNVTRLLGPGDMWRIPGGVLHSVRAMDAPVLAVDVFHPIREDYL